MRGRRGGEEKEGEGERGGRGGKGEKGGEGETRMLGRVFCDWTYFVIFLYT